METRRLMGNQYVSLLLGQLGYVGRKDRSTVAQWQPTSEQVSFSQFAGVRLTCLCGIDLLSKPGIPWLTKYPSQASYRQASDDVHTAVKIKKFAFSEVRRACRTTRTPTPTPDVPPSSRGSR